MLPINFQDNRPFVSGEEAKNRFSRWRPWWSSWVSHRNKFSYSLSTCHPDSRWWPWRPFRILDRNNFSYFCSTRLRCFLPSFRYIGHSIQGKKRKIDFQDSSHGGDLLFLIGKILAIFDLLVTLMLSTKIQVNWSFDSGEAKSRFSRWPPWRPSWISDQNDFSYF